MSFKHFTFLLLFLGSLSILSCKQTKALVDDVPKEAIELENALLWEISGNELKQNSYLYGTIHIIGDEDYFLPNGTEEALNSSEKVVFEINMEELEDMSKIMSIMSQIFMKDGQSLKDLVTDEEYKMIKDHFEDIGIPLFLFERMKPMFLTVFSSGDIKPGALETGDMRSYEMEFMEMGKQKGKEFGGLETIEYQLAVFDSIPYDVQADMLIEAIKSEDSDSDQFQEMVKIYKAQDLNAMQTMFTSEDGGIEGYEDVLLVNRNRNWIPVMEIMMKQKPTFFAVGAGHLGGNFGVINLLIEQGFTLKPLSHLP